jgi:hypothetical protein
MSIDLDEAPIHDPISSPQGNLTATWELWLTSIKNFLDAYVTATGISPARLTTAERDSIISPQVPTIIWNLTTARLEVWNGTTWDAV